MELNKPTGYTRKIATRISRNEYASNFFLSNVSNQHSGAYNCTVVVSGPSLTPTPKILSRSIQLSVGICVLFW